MAMEIEVHLPQLDEANAKLDEIRKVLSNIHEITADTASDVELAVKTVLALDKKIDALGALPEPAQLNLPLTDKSKRTRRQAPETIEVAEPTTVSVNGGSGKGHNDEDVDALRARTAFEARRVNRVLGVGATRATIKRTTGAVILNIDDVPVMYLPELLSNLQAM